MSRATVHSPPKNPIFAIASAILQSERGGFPLIEESCDLAVADCRLNSWLASLKSESGPELLSEDDWVRLLDKHQDIYAHASRARASFRAYDFPRNRPDAWSSHSAALRIALQQARGKIDNLGREFGRTNQREASPGDA